MSKDKKAKIKSKNSVADPGFDLRGGVDFVNGEGGRTSLKMLRVEVKSHF